MMGQIRPELVVPGFMDGGLDELVHRDSLRPEVAGLLDAALGDGDRHALVVSRSPRTTGSRSCSASFNIRSLHIPLLC